MISNLAAFEQYADADADSTFNDLTKPVDHTTTVRTIFSQNGIETQSKDLNGFRVQCPYSSCMALVNCQGDAITGITCHSDKCKGRSIQSFLDGWKIKGFAQSEKNGKPETKTILRQIAEQIKFVRDPDQGLFFLDTNGKPKHVEGLPDQIRKLALSHSGEIQSDQHLKNAAKHAIVIQGDSIPIEKLHLRIGTDDNGATWLNLGSNRFAQLTGGKYSIESSCPLRFIEPETLINYPDPLPGNRGDIEQLFPPNLSANDKVKLIASMLGMLDPTGPYPVLQIVAPAGSAKSHTIKAIARTIDPRNDLVASTELPAPNDLMLIASRCRLVLFDNVSKVNKAQSDAACALATGGGLVCRTLFTTTGVTTLKARRPIILGSIQNVLRQTDMLSRTLLVKFQPLADIERKTEAELTASQTKEFQGRVLGYLLNALALGLERRKDPINRPAKLHRMADWHCLVWNALPALGITEKELAEALAENSEDGQTIAIEDSALLRWLDSNDGFVGTKSKLAEKVASTTSQVSSELPQLVGPLVGLGFTVDLNARNKNRSRIIKIERTNEK